METSRITVAERDALLERTEGHFLDFKSREISPSSLSKTISAMANADGGEIYVGVEDVKRSIERWRGYESEENANSVLGVLHAEYPEGDIFNYRFLQLQGEVELVLVCEINKNQLVWRNTQGDCYLRSGSQNLKQITFEQQERLRLNKGLSSFEDSRTTAKTEELSKSLAFAEFLRQIVPSAEPIGWLQNSE